MSREVSMQSDKTKMVMSDRVMESPGPPPPSPEPKDQEDSLHDSMGAILTDDYNKSVSVDGVTINTIEKSDHLEDDTPRPHNPANTPEQTPRLEGPANTPIPTEATTSVGGTPRPMNIIADIPEEGSVTINNTPREDPLNILPPDTTPATPYESSVGTTVLGVQQSDQGEETQGTGADKTDARPLVPGGGSLVEVDPRVQLDEFDASPADLQQELKEEYEKLSQDDK